MDVSPGKSDQARFDGTSQEQSRRARPPGSQGQRPLKGKATESAECLGHSRNRGALVSSSTSSASGNTTKSSGEPPGSPATSSS